MFVVLDDDVRGILRSGCGCVCCERGPENQEYSLQWSNNWFNPLSLPSETTLSLSPLSADTHHTVV